MIKLSEYTPQMIATTVGHRQVMSGSLFSYKKAIEPTEFNVLDWRWSRSVICDLNNKKDKHPAIEFLVKNETMLRSRWTRAFAVRELVPDENGGWKKNEPATSNQ